MRQLLVRTFKLVRVQDRPDLAPVGAAGDALEMVASVRADIHALR